MMAESDNVNSLQNFAQQRFKFFEDQNVEKGRFDVTFQFGDKQLYAHSFILWPLSKVFENTLFGDLAEKGPIPIERHSYENFKEFIKFLYLEKCEINSENVMALVDLGEYYDIQLLKDHCDTFLTANLQKIENILKIYESLKIYSLKNAMDKVMKFVAANAYKILNSEDFLNAPKETIIDIVKMDDLICKEEDLYTAVLNWTANITGKDKEMIKNEISDILPFIRFPIMNLEFLHTVVVPTGFVFSSLKELSKILCDATAFAQNGSLAQKCSKYSIKSRGGTRLQLNDFRDNKAYAEIKDPKLIEILKNIDQKARHSRKRIPIGNICIPEITNKITTPLPNATHYLVRHNGRMGIRFYQGIDPRFFNFFENVEVIAPVVIENENFMCADEAIFFTIV